MLRDYYSGGNAFEAYYRTGIAEILKQPRKILRLRIGRDTFKIRAKIRLLDFNAGSPEYFFILSCVTERCVFRFHAL